MYFVALYWLKYDSEQILNSTDSFTLAFLQQMEQIAEERKLKKTVWSKFYHSIFCESRVSRQIRSLLLLLLLISSIGCKKTGNVFQVPWEILFFLHLVLMIEKKKNVWDQIYLIWYRRRELDTQTTRMRGKHFFCSTCCLLQDVSRQRRLELSQNTART